MAKFFHQMSVSKAFREEEEDGLRMRQEEAANEPAWMEASIVLDEALFVWRLEEEKPILIKPAEMGFFYNDELYIVLKSSNKNGKLCFDVHFWISLQNFKEAGGKPPKKVYELISLYDDKVVLHREIENYESELFKSYFPFFGVFFDGRKSNFDPENPEAYTPRLLHLKLQKKKVTFRQVKASKQALDKTDVFILDSGTMLSQWNGQFCDEEERIFAKNYVAALVKSRKRKISLEFYDADDLLPDNEFYKMLSNDPVEPKPEKPSFRKSMHRLSDESGELKLIEVFRGKVYTSGINPDDVTFIDTESGFFIYIGPTASVNERLQAWEEADKYLRTTDHPYITKSLLHAGETSYQLNEIWDVLKY